MRHHHALLLLLCISRAPTSGFSQVSRSPYLFIPNNPFQEQERLPLRVYLTHPHDELSVPAAITAKADVNEAQEGASLMPWSGDGGLVSWNRVKIFSDGSLGMLFALHRSFSPTIGLRDIIRCNCPSFMQMPPRISTNLCSGNIGVVSKGSYPGYALFLQPRLCVVSTTTI